MGHNRRRWRNTRINAAELTAAPGPHPAASRYDKPIGQALGIQAFGIYQVELPPQAETVRHDHAEDRAEDVYGVLSGSGVVIVDDVEVPRSGRASSSL